MIFHTLKINRQFLYAPHLEKILVAGFTSLHQTWHTSVYDCQVNGFQGALGTCKRLQTDEQRFFSLQYSQKPLAECSTVAFDWLLRLQIMAHSWYLLKNKQKRQCIQKLFEAQPSLKLCVFGNYQVCVSQKRVILCASQWTAIFVVVLIFTNDI